MTPADRARRDEFAKAALTGALARTDLDRPLFVARVAERCWAMASAMLAHEPKEKGDG